MAAREGTRINILISDKMNKWLDEQSKERAMAKSIIANLALEEYQRSMTIKLEKEQLQKILDAHGISY